MPIDLVAALALAAVQPAETPFQNFDTDAGGWSVNRRPDGCFMFHDSGDDDGTTINVFYKTDGDQPELILIFSNQGWAMRDATVRGYEVRFIGSGGDWTDLAARTFPTEGDQASMVSIAFSPDAIGAMLTDIYRASALTFGRDGQPIDRLGLGDPATGVRRLLDCVRTRSRHPVPAVPADD